MLRLSVFFLLGFNACFAAQEGPPVLVSSEPGWNFGVRDQLDQDHHTITITNKSRRPSSSAK